MADPGGLADRGAKAEVPGAGGGFAWLAQAVSGLLLMLLLGLHMVAHHYVVEGGLRTYQDVLAYVAHPAVAVLEIAFLVVVTMHALLGVRAVLMDLAPKPRQQVIMHVLLGVLGLVMLGYGIGLLFVIRAQI